MRTLKTVYGTVSDWSVVKWSVLIGREQLSRDQMERSDWLIKKLGGGQDQDHPPKKQCVLHTTPHVRFSFWYLSLSFLTKQGAVSAKIRLWLEHS